MTLQEKHYQIAGIIGFIVSALIFLVPACMDGDIFTIAGTIVWIIACLIWLIPLFKTIDGKNDRQQKNSRKNDP